MVGIGVFVVQTIGGLSGEVGVTFAAYICGLGSGP